MEENKNIPEEMFKVTQKKTGRRAWKKGEKKTKISTRKKFIQKSAAAKFNKKKAKEKIKIVKMIIEKRVKKFHYTMSRKFIKDIVQAEGNKLVEKVHNELQTIMDHPVITLEEELLFRNVKKKKIVSISIPIVTELEKRVKEPDSLQDMNVKELSNIMKQVLNIFNDCNKYVPQTDDKDKKRIAKPVYDTSFEIIEKSGE